MLCIKGKRYWGKIDKTKWIKVNISIIDNIINDWFIVNNWLNNNLSSYWYFNEIDFETLYFEKEDDVVLFRLTWM